MTTLSVWQIDSAHCSANCVSCGVAFREAKNATNRLSSKSLFPDKSIKKSAGAALTYPVSRPWLPLTRISNTDSPRRRYIAYTEPIGDGDIHQTRTSDCVSSCYSNGQVRILKITTIKCQLICMAQRQKP